jgi:AraC family transcriptional regulator
MAGVSRRVVPEGSCQVRKRIKITASAANTRQQPDPYQTMVHSASTAVESASAWRTLGGLRVREVRYRAGAIQPRHCHAEGALSLVLAGELEEESHCATHRAAAGSLVVKPADHWHANIYGPRGARVVQVLSVAGPAPGEGTAHTYQWLDAPRLTRRVLALLDERHGAAESAEMELWDVMDRSESPPVRDGNQGRPRWWSDAIAQLELCTMQSISVGAVAGRVGVHPVYLARVCRRQLGCTVQQYVRQRRVLAAWRAWDRQEASLAAIAVKVGFADQAHMTRAFAEVLGLSPGRLRRLVTRPLAL